MKTFYVHLMRFHLKIPSNRTASFEKGCVLCAVRMGLFGILKAFQVFPALFKVHCTLKMSYQKNVPAFSES